MFVCVFEVVRDSVCAYVSVQKHISLLKESSCIGKIAVHFE